MSFRLGPIKIPIQGVDEFSKVMDKAGARVQMLGRGMSSAGRAMTVGMTLPIAAFGFASMKASMDFNAAMANVSTLIPGQQKRLLGLKGSVEELSVATGKSAQDIAGGLYQVISAFGDTADTEQLLVINSRAAVAGLSSVSEAINLTSAVTKAFGDTSAEAAQNVMDMSFVAVKLGQTTFPELAASLPRVTALSEKLGVTQQEMFATMAAATGVTGNTAEVSTQLAGVLGALIKPTADMEIAFKKLGVRSGEELIQQRGLHGTMAALRTLSERYGISLGKLLGRKEALTLSFALTGAQADKYTSSLEAMSDASGATDEAFKEQTEGINEAGFQWAQFRQELAKFMREFGDNMAPMLTQLLEKLRPVLMSLANMSPTMMRNVAVIGAVVAALGPLLMMLGNITLLSGTLMKLLTAKWFLGAMKAIGLVLKGFMLNPVTLIISAFLIWANVIRMVIKYWENLKAAFSSWDMFKKTTKIFFGGEGHTPQTEEERQAGIARARQAMRDRQAGGGADLTQRSVVDVNFKNAPAGMRPEVVSGGDVNLMTELGLLPAGG